MGKNQDRANKIRSLVMLASEKYNQSNETERRTCLNKARDLSEKWNLIDLFIRMYEKYIKPQFEEAKKEEAKKEETKQESRNWQTWTKEDASFEDFKLRFYENARGNMVLKIEYDGKFEYMTITRQKNGKYCVMNPIEHKWNLFDLDHAYLMAWDIFTNNRMEYNDNPFF